MIGLLPKTLNVNGTDRAIRSDYRVALLIFEAYADPEMLDDEKTETMLDCLYEDFDSFTRDDIREAVDKAVWFLDGGKEYEEINDTRRVLDWEQDEKIIFSAVNKVAGFETRAVDYMHWWTFFAYFNEIGEGLLSTVINIRNKRNKGKKLEKHEQEFYQNNKNLVELKVRYTAEEQADIDTFNRIFT